jgi:hypothetical protein
MVTHGYELSFPRHDCRAVPLAPTSVIGVEHDENGHIQHRLKMVPKGAN